jgi:hypothetical protein
MIKQLLLFALMVFLSLNVAFAQLGGLNTYEFLNLSPSARVTSLGANLITVVDDDINLAFANPALLNPDMHHQLSFSHNFHLAGINHGYVAFGQHMNSLNTTFHAGVQYVSYGDFDQTDEFGNVLGTFSPAEYALTIGASRPVYERLSVGANVKLITSQFEGYNSLGVSTDVAAVFRDTASRFTMTVVFKNMGTQISTYQEDNFEPLPFEIQVGISKRLRYLPFRFSIIYQQAQRWNILYDDPDSDEPTLFLGEEESGPSEVGMFFDNLFRHFIFNGEFLFGKKENFRVRVGYNHFRRRELTVENFRSLAGFSFGAGVKINRFRLDYGYGSFHLGGGVNHLTISTNLREFRK